MSETNGNNEIQAARAEVYERADSVWTRGDGAPGVRRHERRELRGPGGRAAIVAGCRTPFAKAGTVYNKMNVVDLASVPAAELVRRLALDPNEIDDSIFGCVIPALKAPNLGREVILRNSFPGHIPGSAVNLACASANRAIVSGVESILLGQANVVLAGGAEALSNVPITYSREASQRLVELSRAKSPVAKAQVLGKLRPKDLAPVAPAIAEYTTGLTMGESTEKMAKENAISREAQDEIALLSHRRAAMAQAEGRFDDQIVATFPMPGYDEAVAHDTGVRPDTNLDKLAGLKPVFDKRYGTLSAGNSSPLTDGGAAVMLMSEDKAKALGYEPLGYVRSYAWSALDPSTQLLQGPAYAAPQALDLAGLGLGDMDLVDMHEAFAAQILSNMKAFASPKFARDELGRDEPLGEIDFDRFNVNGGSISIGHPFGATGARVTMQVLEELKRRGGQYGLITVCAAGGNGFAMVVERE
ncbi:MAG: acetyl-CoA C-acyltransferase FadI [Acidobacteriota bacterium]